MPSNPFQVFGTLKRLQELPIAAFPHFDDAVHIGSGEILTCVAECDAADAVLVAVEVTRGDGRRFLIGELKQKGLFVLASCSELERMRRVESNAEHGVCVFLEGLIRRERDKTYTNRVTLDLTFVAQKCSVFHWVVNTILIVSHIVALFFHYLIK